MFIVNRIHTSSNWHHFSMAMLVYRSVNSPRKKNLGRFVLKKKLHLEKQKACSGKKSGKIPQWRMENGEKQGDFWGIDKTISWANLSKIPNPGIFCWRFLDVFPFYSPPFWGNQPTGVAMKFDHSTIGHQISSSKKPWSEMGVCCWLNATFFGGKICASKLSNRWTRLPSLLEFEMFKIFVLKIPLQILEWWLFVVLIYSIKCRDEIIKQSNMQDWFLFRHKNMDHGSFVAPHIFQTWESFPRRKRSLPWCGEELDIPHYLCSNVAKTSLSNQQFIPLQKIALVERLSSVFFFRWWFGYHF